MPQAGEPSVRLGSLAPQKGPLQLRYPSQFLTTTLLVCDLPLLPVSKVLLLYNLSYWILVQLVLQVVLSGGGSVISS